MVNSDGKLTMLGYWRIVLRQAEELAAAGRFEEALGLANRADVVDHRQALQLRSRLVAELVSRAVRRGEADDLQGALDDLDLAERFGAPPDALAGARLSLAERVAEEVRVHLDAGDPSRVLETVDSLARRKVSGPALRRAREAAEAWQAAFNEGRRGEFARAIDQLDRADRLAAGAGRDALGAARRELEARQKEAHPKIEQLYKAIDSGRWAEVLGAAEAVLNLVPEHPAARQARARAWHQIGAISPSATLPHRNARLAWNAMDARTMPVSDSSDSATPAPAAEPVRAPGVNRIVNPGAINRCACPGAYEPPHRMSQNSNPGPKGRFLLWADSIGGYLVCLDDEIMVGRAGPECSADIPLLGDVSRHHATIVRNGDGYIVRAHKPTFVNGQRVDAMSVLRDGDVLRLGSTLELEFRQPSPISATARLEILSDHRLPVAVEGIILMADTCILGPSNQAHIVAPNLDESVVLYRQGAGLWCRSKGEFEVDGAPCTARGELTLQSQVVGDGFSFSLEPLDPRTGQV
jgi:hypothetical protein